MAVLIEANSVVIRADRLLSVIGSWEAFKQQIPNRTLCADGELVRVGFMLSEDAHPPLPMSRCSAKGDRE